MKLFKKTISALVAAIFLLNEPAFSLERGGGGDALAPVSVFNGLTRDKDLEKVYKEFTGGSRHYELARYELIRRVSSIFVTVSHMADVITRYPGEPDLTVYKGMMADRLKDIGEMREELCAAIDDSLVKGKDGGYAFQISVRARNVRVGRLAFIIYPRDIEIPLELKYSEVEVNLPGGARLFTADASGFVKLDSRKVGHEELRREIDDLKRECAELETKHRAGAQAAARDLSSSGRVTRASGGRYYETMASDFKNVDKVMVELVSKTASGEFSKEADEVIAHCLKFANSAGFSEYYYLCLSTSLVSTVLWNRLIIMWEMNSTAVQNRYIESVMKPVFREQIKFVDRYLKFAEQYSIGQASLYRAKFLLQTYMAEAYYGSGQNDKAREYMLEAFKSVKGIPYKDLWPDAYADMINLYEYLTRACTNLNLSTEGEKHQLESLRLAYEMYKAGNRPKYKYADDCLETMWYYLENARSLDERGLKMKGLMERLHKIYPEKVLLDHGYKYLSYRIFLEVYKGDTEGLVKSVEKMLERVRANVSGDEEYPEEIKKLILMAFENASFYLAVEGKKDLVREISDAGIKLLEGVEGLDGKDAAKAKKNIFEISVWALLKAEMGDISEADRCFSMIDSLVRTPWLENDPADNRNFYRIQSVFKEVMYTMIKAADLSQEEVLARVAGMFAIPDIQGIPGKVDRMLNQMAPSVRSYISARIHDILTPGEKKTDPVAEKNMIEFLILVKDKGIAGKLKEMLRALPVSRDGIVSGGDRTAFILEKILQCDRGPVIEYLDGIDKMIETLGRTGGGAIKAGVGPKIGKKDAKKKSAHAAAVTTDTIADARLSKRLAELRRQFETRMTSGDRLERADRLVMAGEFTAAKGQAELAANALPSGTTGEDEVYKGIERVVTISALWEEASGLFLKRSFDEAYQKITELSEFMAAVEMPDGPWRQLIDDAHKKHKTMTKAEDIYRNASIDGVGKDLSVIIADIGNAKFAVENSIPEAARDKTIKEFIRELESMLVLINSFDPGAGEDTQRKFVKRVIAAKEAFRNSRRAVEICGALSRMSREASVAIDANVAKAEEIFRGIRKRDLKIVAGELAEVLQDLPGYQDRKKVLEIILVEARRYLKDGLYKRAEGLAQLGMRYSAESMTVGAADRETLYTGFREVYRQARGNLVLDRLNTDYDIVNAEVEADLLVEDQKRTIAEKHRKKPFAEGGKEEKFSEKRLVYKFQGLSKFPSDIMAEEFRRKDLIRLYGLRSLKGVKQDNEVELKDADKLIKGSFKIGETYAIVNEDQAPGTRLFLKVVGYEDGYGGKDNTTVLLEPVSEHGRVEDAVEALPSENVLVTKVSDPSMVTRRNLLDKMIWTIKNILSEKEGLTSGNALLDYAVGIKEVPGIADLSKVKVDFENKKIGGDKAQSDAVRAALCPDLPLTLVHGPPGTGKTSVIEEMVKQFVKQGKKVLVVSQSHAGVDNVGLRLKEGGVNFARVGNSPPSEEKIKENWENREEILRNMRGKGAVVLGTNNGFHLDRTLSYKIEPATGRKEYDGYYAGDYDVVIIEEAGRATLAETIVPISFAKQADQGGKVVMVGDHLQLPPYGITVEEVRDVRKALGSAHSKLTPKELDKIFSYDNLKRYRRSLFEMHHGSALDVEIKSTGEQYKHILDINRRSHWAIVGLVSRLFYGGKIKTDEPVNSPDTRAIEKGTFSLIDYGWGVVPRKYEKFSDEGRSYYNIKEANIALREIENTLNLGKEGGPGGVMYRYEPKDITLITPYKSQIAMIKLGISVKAIMKDMVSPLVGDDAAYLFSDEKLKLLGEALGPDGDEEDLYGLESACLEGLPILRERLKRIAGKMVFDIDIDDLASKRNIRWMELGDIDMMEVETVDSIQGSENKVVILSLVRSNLNGEIGFLGTYDGLQRLDVAFSRAKERLSVIGDFTHTLTKAVYFARKEVSNRNDMKIVEERKTSTLKAREIFTVALMYSASLEEGMRTGRFAVSPEMEVGPDDVTPEAIEERRSRAEVLETPVINELRRVFYKVVDEARNNPGRRVIAFDMGWVPASQKTHVTDIMDELRQFLERSGLKDRLDIILSNGPASLAGELKAYLKGKEIRYGDIVIVSSSSVGALPGADPFDIFKDGNSSAFKAYFKWAVKAGGSEAGYEFTDLDIPGNLRLILEQAFGEYGKTKRRMEIEIKAEPVDTEILRIRNEARLAALRRA
ncbi:MAG: AAA family ATPase [Candidatus Omnitrophica bacterium]|nr:AAA family ATPase [Candidatus Omnitrophota bacterium]